MIPHTSNFGINPWASSPSSIPTLFCFMTKEQGLFCSNLYSLVLLFWNKEHSYFISLGVGGRDKVILSLFSVLTAILYWADAMAVNLFCHHDCHGVDSKMGSSHCFRFIQHELPSGILLPVQPSAPWKITHQLGCHPPHAPLWWFMKQLCLCLSTFTISGFSKSCLTKQS